MKRIIGMLVLSGMFFVHVAHGMDGNKCTWIATPSDERYEEIGLSSRYVDEMKSVSLLLRDQKGKNSKDNPIIDSIGTCEDYRIVCKALRAIKHKTFAAFFANWSVKQEKQDQLINAARRLGATRVVMYCAQEQLPIGIQPYAQDLLDKINGYCVPYTVLPFVRHQNIIQSVAFSPDGKSIVSSSDRDKSLCIWDMHSQKPPRILKSDLGYVFSIASDDANKETVISDFNSKALNIWDLKKLTISENSYHPCRALVVLSLALSSDGKKVASCLWDEYVRIWDAETGELWGKLEGHEKYVRAVAFSFDGKKIVSGADDKTIRIWDGESKKLLRTFNVEVDHDVVCSVAFSSDAKRVVSGFGATIWVWDVESGQLLSALKGPKMYARVIAISLDGKTVVSGSFDAIIRVWDVKSEKLLHELQGYEMCPHCVALSPDSSRVVASVGFNHSLLLWDLCLFKKEELRITDIWLLNQFYRAAKKGHRVKIEKNSYDQAMYEQLPEQVKRNVNKIFLKIDS